MKKVIVMLSTVVLAGFAPVDKVEPVLETTEKNILHTTPSLPPTCPFYAPPTSNVTDASDSDGVAVYVHCSKCQQGVMTEHTDGEVKCTFCGEKN